MHKNGVFNVLEGCDGEIEIEPKHNEGNVTLPCHDGSRVERKATAKIYEKNLSKEAEVEAIESVDHKQVHSGSSRDDEYLHDKPSAIQQTKIQVLPEIDEGEKVEQNNNDMGGLYGTKGSESVPYSLLKGIRDISLLPEGVDPLNREMALSEQEFQEIFGMDKKSFSDLPTWKKTNHKKKALLF